MNHHMTPYDDEYATCEMTYVTLRIYGERLEPDSVSKHLGIRATTHQLKGEVFINKLGRRRQAPIGGWFLSTEKVVQSRDVRRHLDWLLDNLCCKKEELSLIQSWPGVYMTLTCVWWSAYGEGGPTLWPEQLRRLAELDLELGFSISFIGDDIETPTPNA